jgi:hypothetical protein
MVSNAQEVGSGVPYGAETANRQAGSGVSFRPIKGLPLIGFGIGVFVVCSIIQTVFGSSMFSGSYYIDSAGIIGALLINLTFYPGWLVTIFSIIGGIGAMFKKPETKRKELMKKAETARMKGDILRAQELEARAQDVTKL